MDSPVSYGYPQQPNVMLRIMPSPFFLTLQAATEKSIPEMLAVLDTGCATLWLSTRYGSPTLIIGPGQRDEQWESHNYLYYSGSWSSMYQQISLVGYLTLPNKQGSPYYFHSNKHTQQNAKIISSQSQEIHIILQLSVFV